MANYATEMQRIVRQYRDDGQPWPATARDMANWAIRNGLWKQRPDSAIRECSEDLSRAMREEYITDPRGRTVRSKHAARITKNGVQAVLWADIFTAPREHMQIAFQQRRQQIVGDCRQLKLDVDSYNEQSSSGAPIQMVFDFTEDLLELEALEEEKSEAA